MTESPRETPGPDNWRYDCVEWTGIRRFGSFAGASPRRPRSILHCFYQISQRLEHGKPDQTYRFVSLVDQCELFLGPPGRSRLVFVQVRQRLLARCPQIHSMKFTLRFCINRQAPWWLDPMGHATMLGDPCCDCLLRRKSGDVPPTAQGLNQLYAARHLLHTKGDHGLLIGE
jgi:hypothetical protein